MLYKLFDKSFNGLLHVYRRHEFRTKETKQKNETKQQKNITSVKHKLSIK